MYCCTLCGSPASLTDELRAGEKTQEVAVQHKCRLVQQHLVDCKLDPVRRPAQKGEVALVLSSRDEISRQVCEAAISY